MASRRGICELEISLDDVFCPTVNVWKPDKTKYSVLAVMDKAEDAVKIAEVQAAIYELAWSAWPEMKDRGLTYTKKVGGFGTVATQWFQDGDKQTKPYYWNQSNQWKPNPKSFGQVRVYAATDHPPKLYLHPDQPMRHRLNDQTARQWFWRNQTLKRVGIVLTADDNDHGRRIASRLRSATCE